MFDEQAHAEFVLSLHGRHAPAFLNGEKLDQYDRRLTYEVQKCAPNYKDINLYDASGEAYKLLKRQVYVDAQQEAKHPTNIPEGTLKEVTSYDAAGRPSYTYYGSPSAWMKDFAMPKKRLVGIIMDNRSFQKI